METAWDRAQRVLDDHLSSVSVLPLVRSDGAPISNETVMLGCINCAFDAAGLPHPQSYEIQDIREDRPQRYRLTKHKRVSLACAKCQECGLERRWGL